MDNIKETAPQTEIIIIGAGPGGYEAAAYAARHGLRVTIYEEREVGGTCLNRGCIPTKALVHSAELLLQGSTSCGVYATGVERKDSVVSQLREGVEAVLSHPNITLVRERASLSSLLSELSSPLSPSSSLHSPLSSKKIILATGSHTKLPPIEGIDDKTVITSDELLALRQLPRRLCIVGAGVIGMEFASILTTWGVEVTVVEYLKECLPALDQDIAKRLRKALEKRGIRFVMQAAVKSIHDGVVTYERKGKTDTVEAELVLVATGRAPSVEGLGLDEAGVKYTKKGITVDDNMQTSVPDIYAIGDCNGRSMLAHAATFQGYRAVNHILGKKDSIRLDIIPAAIFTWPEAASVGLSEDEAKVQGISVKIGKGFHRSNGKALTMNEPEGMVKLMVDAADGRILGCHAYGAHAADMVQEVAALMNKAATAQDLAATVHIHPTVGEVLHAAAASLE